GRIEDHLASTERARALALENHRQRRAVFDGAAGITRFELGVDLHRAGALEPAEAYERRVADRGRQRRRCGVVPDVRPSQRVHDSSTSRSRSPKAKSPKPEVSGLTATNRDRAFGTYTVICGTRAHEVGRPLRADNMRIRSSCTRWTVT